MANSPDHRNTVAMCRLRKFRMVFIGLPVALVLFVTVSAYWLLNTTSGALWVWGKVEHVAAGAIRVSGIEGDLSTGLILKNIEFQQDDLEVQAQRVELTAGPGWLPFSIQIKGLHVQDVESPVVRASKNNGVKVNKLISRQHWRNSNHRFLWKYTMLH